MASSTPQASEASAVDLAKKIQALKVQIDDSWRKDKAGTIIASDPSVKVQMLEATSDEPTKVESAATSSGDATDEMQKKVIADVEAQQERDQKVVETMCERVIGSAAGPTLAPPPRRRRRKSKASESSSSSPSSSSTSRSRSASKRGRRQRRDPHPRGRRSASPCSRRGRIHSRHAPSRAPPRQQQVYTINFVQVVDDRRWDSELVDAAFPGLVETSGTALLIHTSLQEQEVVQRVDDAIGRRFRVYYDGPRRTFKVCHPPTERHEAATGRNGPRAPPGPPPDHLKGKGKNKSKGKSKGKKMSKGKSQQPADPRDSYSEAGSMASDVCAGRAPLLPVAAGLP